MNPVTRFCLVSLSATALLIAGALMDGPDDIQAAQDVADDAAALQHATDKAECRKADVRAALVGGTVAGIAYALVHR